MYPWSQLEILGDGVSGMTRASQADGFMIDEWGLKNGGFLNAI
jgi:hypothetical protein